MARRLGDAREGRWLPLDPDPVEGGRWYAYRPARAPLGPLECRFMESGADWPTGSLPRNPHWMTCPAAEEFRRKRAEGSRSGRTSPQDQRRIEEFVVRQRHRESDALAGPSARATEGGKKR